MSDAPVIYESLEAMKMGPRSYTGEQAEAIRQAVANRKPPKGPAPPLEPRRFRMADISAEDERERWRERWRDEYDWPEKDIRGLNGRCATCDEELDQWSEQVLCCGHPYKCTDTLYVYACHNCRTMTDDL